MGWGRAKSWNTSGEDKGKKGRDPGVPETLGCSYFWSKKYKDVWHSTHECTKRNTNHTVHKCSCGNTEDENNPT